MPFLKVNDLQMYYTERGDGPTVVVLHAATSSSVEVGWLVQAVVHEGFNAVAPDLRGHGSTPNPSPTMHMPQLVDDLLEFIYQLGRTPAHALGFSLGGIVALYAAQRRPDLFRSLVMLGGSHHAPTPQRLLDVLGPVEERPEIQQRVFDAHNGVVVGWDRPLEAFRSVTCPTLIITGDRDEFHDAESNLALYRAMPNAEVLVVPYADHLGLVRHPLIYQALMGFYSRVPR